MVLLSSLGCLSNNLNRFFDCNKTFSRSGHRTLYEEQIVFRIHPYNLKILNRNLYATHMTGHSLALEHTARRGARTIGTLVTMEFGTMGHGASVLSVSLDRALESFSFGNGRCVDLVPGCKHIRFDFASKRIFFSVFKFELSDISLAGYARLVKVSLHCLSNTVSVDNLSLSAFVHVGNSFLLVHKADLHRTVTVVFRSLDLRHHAGSGLDRKSVV